MAAAGVRLTRLIERAGLSVLSTSGGDPVVTGVQLDSRCIGRGDLFLALPGEHYDGERFVPQAIERGAVAVVARSPRPDWVAGTIAWARCDEPRRVAGPLAREILGRPDERLTLVGVTGTNGKTTVCHLVESIARAAGRRPGRIGTTGHAYGDRRLPATHTTPEAPEMFRLLDEMARAGIEVVAMEVSSHALDQGRVRGARFQVAAFLNLSREHLDYHGTEEAYFRAKAILFEDLGPERHAVLPDDEAGYGARLRKATRAQVTRFGRGPQADVRLTDERGTIHGSRATLVTPAGEIEVSTRLLGRFNLDNVAAAAACALSMGLPAEAIVRGVASLDGVPGRLEPVDRGQPFGVVVDFAHTEEALRNLLTELRALTEGRLLVVFGCGGDRDRGKRPGMGRLAATLADRVYLTSDNPRSEPPESILDAIETGVREAGAGAERYARHVDRGEAIHAAIGDARAGDTVVIAGKGHETVQIVGATRRPFDDRLVAADALAGSGFEGQGGAGADA